MKWTVSALALALAGAAAPPLTDFPPAPTPPAPTTAGDTTVASEDDGGRIVGGVKAVPENIAWQIELFSTHEYTQDDLDNDTNAKGAARHYLAEMAPWERIHRCGGAYIGDGWILTAAHCVVDIPKDLNFLQARAVRMGTLNLAGDQGARFPIDRAIVHQDFVFDEPYPNDIALLHIVVPRSGVPAVMKAIKPLDSAKGDRPVAPADNLRATGWGLSLARTSGGGPFAAAIDARTGKPVLNHGIAVLQQVPLSALPATNCAVYPDVMADKTICAGSPEAGRDACNGDSGGPLTRAQGNRRVLVGLVSWGRGCAQKGFPGVYTRVDAYRDWIARAKQVPATGAVAYIR